MCAIGFTCLIQISTRREDFLIDPFPLMDELHVLNNVTADPKIVKVPLSFAEFLSQN